MLQAVATYAFVQCSVDVLVGVVNSNDSETMSIDERLGFRRVATLEGYFPDGDQIVYQMKRDECRWIPKHLRRQEEPDG